MKAKVCLLIVCIFSLFSLTGCYNSNGVEAKAYAIALGIDKSDTHNLKLSLQFAVLNSSESSTNSSDSSSNDNSTIIAVDCSTIDSGISLINSYISKEVNLSHCKAIIVSEDYAYEGVSDIIYTLMNNIELRPDCNIIISKCSAKDYLDNSIPLFESNTAQYFELNFNSSEYTGNVENLYLSDFYYNVLSSSSDACAILAGLNTDETHSKTDYNSSNLDSNYYPGNTPIDSKNSVESIGTAVFNGDKFVGELNNLETVSHLIISNKLKNGTINIINPFDSNTTISIYISQSKDTQKSVTFINGSPYIECEIYIAGNITTIYNSIDLSSESCVATLNSALSQYMEENISSYLYKTSQDYKSDIDKFGEYVLPKYLTWNDWLDSNWLRKLSKFNF